MAVVQPKLCLGIPISDANFGRPTMQAWTKGAQIEVGIGQLVALPYSAFKSWPYANPYGNGRSIWIDLNDTLDGTEEVDGIVSAPTTFGLYPPSGVSADMVLALIHTFDLGNDGGGPIQKQTAEWRLIERDVNGDVVQNSVFVTFDEDSTGNASGDWRVDVQKSAIEIHADTRYFELRLSFDAKVVDDGHYGLDFVGLGWLPYSSTSDGMYQFDKWYDAEGFYTGYDSGAVSHRPQQHRRGHLQRMIRLYRVTTIIRGTCSIN
jgi:hypothetical protein